jgi:hypothetical protein
MTQPSLSLNTSKRKFYKLLDNLSSSRVQLPADNSNKNASTTTLAAEPPSKRFRLLGKDLRPGTAPSTPARPLTASARERPKSSIFAVNSSAKTRPKSFISEKDVTGTIDQQKNTPYYAPWSHDQFLARLKTFADVRSWTPKPAAIGEVEWAKRGWTVVAKDTVGCKGGCEKRLVVRITEEEENRKPKENEDGDDWWMGDLEKEMVNKYKSLIVDAHAKDCLWRRAGCKDDIYRIKMADPVTWQTELRERYLSLLAVESSLPAKLDLRAEGMDEEQVALGIEELAQLVPPDVLRRSRTSTNGDDPANSVGSATGEAPADNINKIALAMALTGWSSQSQNSVHIAYCTKCFQRAGLWLYKSRTSATTITSPSIATSEDLVFNPIDQHREHCPWKNLTTQCAPGRLEGMAGWQVLVSLVKGYRRHDRSPTKKTPSRPVSAYTDGSELGEDEELYQSREEQDKEDKERKGRLQRLKRAFTVRKGNNLSKSKE